MHVCPAGTWVRDILLESDTINCGDETISYVQRDILPHVAWR